MVADLTRYAACTVDPDFPDRPVRARKTADDAVGAERRGPVKAATAMGDTPVRLFAWVSA